VEPATATDVLWGVLFEFDAAEKPLLNEAEALGRGYDELIVEVESETGKKESAPMYIAAKSHIDDTLKPYSWYKRFVMEGATQHRLPQAYIDFLQSFPAVEDPDRARDRRNRAITC